MYLYRAPDWHPRPPRRFAPGSRAVVFFSGTVPTINGTQNASFSADLSSYFGGAYTPFTYSLQAGVLPTGLSLNTSTGVISGTPTLVETQTGIVIRATDTSTATADTNSFSIDILAASASVGGADVIQINFGGVRAFGLRR